MGCGFLFGQKQITKTLLEPGIQAISVDAALAYKLELETADTQDVSVEARMEGEYSPDLLVVFRESGNTLFIETRLSPNFIMPNDKLGAHKVFSIYLKVTLPEHQDVFVSAASCEINTKGAFNDLEIVFNDGSCQLAHKAENTAVRTASAPITVYLDSGKVQAESKYGNVHLTKLPPGDHHLKLNTIRGDISVLSL